MERMKIGCEKTDDETVDNDDALTDADMLELFNSNREEKLS